MKYFAISLVVLVIAGCSSTWKQQTMPNDTATPVGQRDMTYRSGI